MLKRALCAAAAWIALTGMQAPPAAPSARPALSLWRLDCGDFVFNDYNSFFSDTSEYPSGPKRLVGSCYLIRHGDDYMLWDTGIPAATVGHPLTTPQLTATLRSSIATQLAQLGVRPEQVGRVGISHYHFDHSGQAADFPHARLLIGAGDLAAVRGPTGNDAGRAAFRPWLEGGAPVTEAQGDLDVFADGSVVMVSLPGHTPGHHGLLVRLASGPVLLSGDMYHFTEQVARRGVPPFNTSRAETLASMDRFDRLVRNLHARMIIQHEPADVAKLPAFPEAAR
ncbi:MAG TPA: N-acyl homoserine lactonase family protein [Allosphingosinicella sp.]